LFTHSHPVAGGERDATSSANQPNLTHIVMMKLDIYLLENSIRGVKEKKAAEKKGPKPRPRRSSFFGGGKDSC